MTFLPAIRLSNEMVIADLAVRTEAYSLPREGYENTDYFVVIPRNEAIAQVRIGQVLNQDQTMPEAERRIAPAQDAWIRPSWVDGGPESLRINSKPLRPGNYSAGVEMIMSKGPSMIRTVSFSVSPGRIIFSGTVMDVAADLDFFYALTPLGIRMLHRGSGALFEFIPLPAGRNGLSVCRLEKHLLVLCEQGIMHVFNQPDFKRKTVCLAPHTAPCKLQKTGADTFSLLTAQSAHGFAVDARGDVRSDPTPAKPDEPNEHLLVPCAGTRITVPVLGREYSLRRGEDHQTIALPAQAPGDVVNKLLPGDLAMNIPDCMAMLNGPVFEILEATPDGLQRKESLDRIPFCRPYGHRFSGHIAFFVAPTFVGCRDVEMHNRGASTNVSTLTKVDYNINTGRFATALSRNNSIYCVGDASGRITFYNTSSTKTASLVAHADNAHCINVNDQKCSHNADVTVLCFHPGGTRMYSGGLDSMLKEHRIALSGASPEISPSWSVCLEGNPQDIAYHPKQFLIITTPQVLYLLSPDGGDILSKLRHGPSYLDPIAILNDDEFFVGDWDGKIHRIVFGDRGLARREAIPVSTSSILNLQKINDKTLLAITEDYQGHLVDVESKQVLARYRHVVKPGSRRGADLLASFDGNTYLIRTDDDAQAYSPQAAFPFESMTVREGRLMLSPKELAMATKTDASSPLVQKDTRR